MAKSAPETDTAFDAVIRLGDVAPLAPANLRDAIYLGIRLTSEGDALSELVFLTDPQAARAQRDPGAPQLLDVRLQVRWGDGRGQALQWRTLRLAPHDINQAASP